MGNKEFLSHLSALCLSRIINSLFGMTFNGFTAHCLCWCTQENERQYHFVNSNSTRTKNPFMFHFTIVLEIDSIAKTKLFSSFIAKLDEIIFLSVSALHFAYFYFLVIWCGCCYYRLLLLLFSIIIFFVLHSPLALWCLSVCAFVFGFFHIFSSLAQFFIHYNLIFIVM